MLILALHQTPSVTQERYEEVVLRLTGKSRIESASDLPFEGRPRNRTRAERFFVFDIFECAEAVERFREALGTIPEEVGIDEPPQLFPAAWTGLGHDHRLFRIWSLRLPSKCVCFDLLGLPPFRDGR
jgi:hypothetical protein